MGLFLGKLKVIIYVNPMETDKESSKTKIKILAKSKNIEINKDKSNVSLAEEIEVLGFIPSMDKKNNTNAA